ncbi:MAG TPA: sugar ABC transporter ATP-binding protein [Chthoniobacteraceae bacterium]|jgi:ABC-type sugar transport system ATPase subunit|nr:sugar ABC transporter ATP-binding protein [Chthoniobacteraceae bacterium]
MLECKDIRKHYGGVYALRGVDFSIRPGEVHALCGENGAGKSTLARIIAGVTRADGGQITLDGQAVTIAHPARARALGIGIVFQELDLFKHLTIAENIALAHPDFPRSRVDRAALDAFCRPYLERVGLDFSPRSMLGGLGLAAAQLVAIARALSMRAKILLLDEPTSSLTEEAAERLLGLVREIRQSGAGIVYVSHKMKEIFRIADRVTVLRDGRHISTMPAAETSIEETIRLMVGREIDLLSRVESAPKEECGLRVNDLSTRRLKKISFAARRGEILGVAGLVGSGRSSLGQALFGLHEWTAGQVDCLGKNYRPRSPREAMRSRFAYLAEDRRSEGLFLNTSIRHNASAAILPALSRGGWIRGAREKALVREELARTRTKMAGDTLPVSALSGGNQQKVLLAKWLLTGPEVLFLDDPTRGVDIGAKEDIYQMIEALAAKGKTILFASSELLELQRCSHRIMVMCEGRCAGILETAASSQEQIMTLATGQASL